MPQGGSDTAEPVDALTETTGRGARGAAWVGVGQLAVNGVSSGILLLLAAHLSPADLGVLALGQMIFVVGNTLQDFGFWDVLIYYRGDARKAAATALSVLLVTSAVLAGGIVLGAPALAGYFHEPRAAPVIAVSGALLLCYAVADVPLGLRTRDLQLRQRVLVQAGSVLLGGITTALLLLVVHLGIAAMVIGQSVQGLSLLLLAWGAGPRVAPRWDRGLAGELFAYGRHSFGASLLTVAQFNVDYLVVARVLGAAALGVYSLAFRVAFLPFLLVTRVLQSTMFAVVCRVEREQEKVVVLLRYTDAILLLVTPLAAGLVLYAPGAVVLGPQWEAAVPVVRALGLYCLLASTASVAEAGLKAVGAPQRAFASSGVHLALLTVALVPAARYGVTAVALLRVVVAGLVTLLAWHWLSRRMSLPVLPLLRTARTPLLAVLAMAAVAFFTSSPTAGAEPAVVPLVLSAAAAVLAYALVVAVSRPDQRRQLLSRLHR